MVFKSRMLILSLAPMLLANAITRSRQRASTQQVSRVDVSAKEVIAARQRVNSTFENAEPSSLVRKSGNGTRDVEYCAL